MAARPLACARLPIHGQHGMDLCPPRPTLRINTMRLALKDKWMTSQLKFHVCLVSQGNKLTSGLTTAHGCNWISLKLRCKKHKSGKVIFLFACCKGKGFFMAEIIFPKIISFCQTFKALSWDDSLQLARYLRSHYSSYEEGARYLLQLCGDIAMPHRQPPRLQCLGTQIWLNPHAQFMRNGI